MKSAEYRGIAGKDRVQRGHADVDVRKNIDQDIRANILRYKSAYAVFQQAQKSRFSNGFVDNSIIFVIKTN